MADPAAAPANTSQVDRSRVSCDLHFAPALEEEKFSIKYNPPLELRGLYLILTPSFIPYESTRP
jgi:hypothetical protein